MEKPSFYSVENYAKRGVAIPVKNKFMNGVLKESCINERLTFVKVSADPVDILMYMPTSAHDDEKIETIYNVNSEIFIKEKI